ncbi:hypothetical protein [Micropruina sp.]|uniref:hypothetical protein n=1 Tax=Micropruina sp. TaxID=2737536 RepID=UPI0039E3C323
MTNDVQPNSKVPRPRGALRRWLAVRKVDGLTKTERSHILAILDEYALKARDQIQDGGAASFLEIGLVSYSSSAIDYAETQCADAQEALGSRRALRSRCDLASKRPAPPDPDAFAVEPEESRDTKAKREKLDELKSQLGPLLELRARLSGTTALTRMMHPRLVSLVTILSSICQVWIFVAPLMDGRWELSWSSVLQFLGSLIFASIAPAVVWISSLAIARAMDSKRAESVRGGLREIDAGVSLNLPSVTDVENPGVVERFRHAIPLEWIGTSILAAALLSFVSLLLFVGGWLAAIGIVNGAPPQGFDGPINVLAVLFTIIPAGVVLGHIGGTNQLLDDVEAAEREVKEAELALQEARDVDASRHASILRGLMRDRLAYDSVRAEMVREWEVMDAELVKYREFLGAREEVLVSKFVASSWRIVAIARGLNEYISLACTPEEHQTFVEGLSERTGSAIRAIFEGVIADIDSELGVPAPSLVLS